MEKGERLAVQRCAREGGVWDESQLAPDAPLGGVCISAQQAQQLLRSHLRSLQELNITLSSDGALDAFAGGLPGNDTTIRWLARRWTRPCDAQACRGPSPGSFL